VTRTLAVVGGGWAGLAAAVAAQDAGWHVTLLEASPHWGGRARTLSVVDETGTTWPLDNGQHILIGAYTATLGLMRRLGVPPTQVLQRVPLTLCYPDGSGLVPPAWGRRLPPRWAPLALGAALLSARPWPWRARLAALRALAGWLRPVDAQSPDNAVADLCAGLPDPVVRDLIEPLCVAALNTPIDRASARVWRRVLRDALLAPAPTPWAPSDLLLPRTDLGRLLPEPATAALRAGGAVLRTGARVVGLQRAADQGWRLQLASGDTLQTQAVVLACPVAAAARLLAASGLDAEPTVAAWCATAAELHHQPIATVYLRPPPGWRWPAAEPMLALRAHPAAAPAQFAFWREPLPGRAPVLALVASAPAPALATDRGALLQAVHDQLQRQLGLGGCAPLATVVEKRATFACTPGLRRPGMHVAPGLLAAGDAIDGPYPATLEGAVRSGLAAAAALTSPN
jgi:squalene-associated FAD-dependent desaturase